jgi:hypothetical protein
LATSHHGGAGKVTREQAASLYRARHVILVADLDDAGAYDVILRHNLLIDKGDKLDQVLGVRKFQGRLDIVRAKVGKDAYDHLAAGYGLEQFVPVDRARLCDAAGRYQADLESNTDRYMNGSIDVRYEDAHRMNGGE